MLLQLHFAFLGSLMNHPMWVLFMSPVCLHDLAIWTVCAVYCVCYCGNKVQTTLRGSEEQLRTNTAYCNMASKKLKYSATNQVQCQ